MEQMKGDKNGPTPDIIFYAYISRSGSTVFAKHLNTFKSIAVTPESAIYSLVGNNFHTDEDIHEVLNFLYSDERFLTWNIDRDALYDKLSTIHFPFTFKEFHDVIIKEFAGKYEDIGYVLSKSSVLTNLNAIYRFYPNSLIIFIYRDVRAVCNSLIKTYNPHIKRSMKGNTIMLSLHFNRLRKLESKKKYHSYFVKYEDFILGSNYILENLRKKIQVKKEYKNDDYSNILSENQKKLHKNLNKPLDIKRIDVWKEELDPTYIFLLQLFSRRSLKYFGYECITIDVKSINLKILFSEVLEFFFYKKMGVFFILKGLFRKL